MSQRVSCIPRSGIWLGKFCLTLKVNLPINEAIAASAANVRIIAATYEPIPGALFTEWCNGCLD